MARRSASVSFACPHAGHRRLSCLRGPGFDVQSVIVAEWRFDSMLDRVAVYEVDRWSPRGASSSSSFRGRGAYFEPVTGDYLFLSWGTGEDRVYAVRGFVPPPLF